MFVSQRPQSTPLLIAPRRGQARRRARSRSGPKSVLGMLRLHLSAGWHGSALDRELAEGADPQTSPVLAVRARKLTCARGRKLVADGLAGALRRAEDPSPGITAAVRPRTRELLDARTVLATIERRLRGSGEVSAHGMARLHVLLTDPTSPLYRPSEPGVLASRLRAAAAALEPADRRAPASGERVAR